MENDDKIIFKRPERTAFQIQSAKKLLAGRVSKSDPFLIGRVLTHYRLGLVEIDDIAAGYTG